MEKRINKHVYTWVGTFLFGFLSVNRFMRGQIGIGIFKLFTIGGFYLMFFIDFIIALTKLGKYEKDFVFTPDGEWFSTAKGKRTYSDGRVYEGDLVNGKWQHGKGKLTLPDGSVYEGDFVYDEVQGKAKMTSPDGFVYEGDFFNSYMHGKGKLRFPDGSVYEGDFVKRQMTGKGNFIFSDGRHYEGDFVNAKRDGKGKMSYPDGKVEEGNWKDNEFLG
jgi:TM2 domain-containing membrane protein YozV